MNSFETRVARQLAEFLDNHMKEKVGQLIAGTANSYDQYRERVGYLAALDFCLQALVEVEQSLQDADRPQQRG